MECFSALGGVLAQVFWFWVVIFLSVYTFLPLYTEFKPNGNKLVFPKYLFVKPLEIITTAIGIYSLEAEQPIQRGGVPLSPTEEVNE